MRLVRAERVLLLILLGQLAIETGDSAKRPPRRDRSMLRRLGVKRDNFKPKICFDLVGCFADPPPRLTLKRAPEHPGVIRTRFLLYTRSSREQPESLQYGDDLKSILRSEYRPGKPLKVIVHGYKGSGSDAGAILLARAFLDMEDANVLVLDWTKGAATTYAIAVANTELVGRQLGLVLLDAINLGTSPANIHVVGFSLGAHVAGCASEILKKKNLLPGRITGLDPASPFFRNHLFRERSRKLDASDASLVDVIHTDGSEDFVDGFGLLKPLGHVDFFPNGGKQQPGCTDVKNSVVVSHVREDTLTKELACSHLRAWAYFLESVRAANESCKFTGWPCPNGQVSYASGACFPLKSTMWSQEMGYRADRGPLGVYYLPTRHTEPFCGEPFRASVTVSDQAPRTTGVLFVKINDRHLSIAFDLRCALPNRKTRDLTFYDIAAAEHAISSGNNLSTIEARIWYQRDEDPKQNATKNYYSDSLLVNKIAVEDREGNKWEYCNRSTSVNPESKVMVLHRAPCSPP